MTRNLTRWRVITTSVNTVLHYSCLMSFTCVLCRSLKHSATFNSSHWISLKAQKKTSCRHLSSAARRMQPRGRKRGAAKHRRGYGLYRRTAFTLLKPAHPPPQAGPPICFHHKTLWISTSWLEIKFRCYMFCCVCVFISLLTDFPLKLPFICFYLSG